MQIFLFDLLAYDKHFEEFKADRFMPYPLPGSHFDPEIAARTYAEHLAIWEEMDRLGYDGVGLNEHHTTPHGLMNSPNLMAAAAAQRTTRLKFFILGNLLPLHNPLRIAEELAMVDCLSRGRIMAGFARGVPREYKVYDVPMAESRARFDEALDVILAAWTQDVFTHKGRYWSFKDVAIWPRPFQRPHPPVWIPFTGSQETIEQAAAGNFGAAIHHTDRDVIADMIAHFARSLSRHGHRIGRNNSASWPTPGSPTTPRRRSRNTARISSTSTRCCGITAVRRRASASTRRRPAISRPRHMTTHGRKIAPRCRSTARRSARPIAPTWKPRWR